MFLRKRSKFGDNLVMYGNNDHRVHINWSRKIVKCYFFRNSLWRPGDDICPIEIAHNRTFTVGGSECLVFARPPPPSGAPEFVVQKRLNKYYLKKT